MLVELFKFKGIKKRMIISFSVLMFLMLMFQQAANYHLMTYTVKNINSNYITERLKQKDEKMNSFFKEIDLFSKALVSDRQMKILLTGENSNNLSISSLFPEIQYALSNNIVGLFLISENGSIYKEAEFEMAEHITLNLNPIMQAVEQSKGEMLFFNTQFINYGLGERGDYVFFVARKIKDIDSFQDIGAMIIAVSESKLIDSIISDKEAENIYVISDNGEIISSREKKSIGNNILDEYDGAVKKTIFEKDADSYISGDWAINFLSNKTTGWKILNVSAISELNSNYDDIQRINLITGAIAIIIGIYISMIISRKITRPIRDMIHSMKGFMAGKFDVQAKQVYSDEDVDELNELRNVFNQMTGQIQHLVREVYQKSLNEKEAELRALRAQINPHFLYNTLDTIYWMLIIKNDEEIAPLVTKLGEILRYSIKKGSSSVTVREEIQQVENYLFIQKARFEDNIEYSIEIDEDILDCKMLSFLIQPFVENAINHGIMDRKGAGRITIKGYRNNRSLYFEIIDNGVGISPEKIDGLLNGKDREEGIHQTGEGIGIANVNARIKYYYSDDYGVSIDSEKDVYTKVTVRIPIIEKEGLMREI